MSLAIPHASNTLWTSTNQSDVPSTSVGTSVTPSGSGGNWTRVRTAAEVSEDVECIFLCIGSTSSSGANRLVSVDVGVDPAGGSSYSTVLSRLLCGKANTIYNTGGTKFVFPLRIKAGSSIAVRGLSNYTTSFYVIIKLYGKRGRSGVFPVGTYSQTIGYSSAATGTSFTPGANNYGGYYTLGTTTKDLWWWQSAWALSNSTVTAEYVNIQFAWGDSSSKRIIHTRLHAGTTSETCLDTLGENLVWHASYCEVPAGSTLYVRGNGYSSPDTGYSALLIGIGG